MTQRHPDFRDPALVAAWAQFFAAIEGHVAVPAAIVRLHDLGADPYSLPPVEYDEPWRHGGAGKGECA